MAARWTAPSGIEKVSRCQCTQGSVVAASPPYSGPVTGSLPTGPGELHLAEADLRGGPGGHLGAEGGGQLLGPEAHAEHGLRRLRPPAPIRSRSGASHGWSAASWTPMGPPITTRPATDPGREGDRRGRCGPRRTGGRARPAPRRSDPGPRGPRAGRSPTARSSRRSRHRPTPARSTRSPPRGRPRPASPRAGRRPGRCPTSSVRSSPRGARRHRPGSGATGGRPA